MALFCKSLYCLASLKRGDSHICFCIQSVTICCFCWSIWRKLAPHEYVVRKGQESFPAFPNNCGYSLLLHQNSISTDFLQVSCSVESETVSTNFSYSVTLNPLVYLTLWMDLLPVWDFAILWIGHLKIRPWSVRKLSSSWLQTKVVQNSKFCLKGQILSLATNTNSCSPCSDMLASFIFKKMYVKYPRKRTNLSTGLFCFPRKNESGCSCFQLKQAQKCDSLRQWPCFGMPQQCFICTAHLITQKMKRMCSQR